MPGATIALQRMAVTIRSSAPVIARSAAGAIEVRLREQAARDTNGSMRLRNLPSARMDTTVSVRPSGDRQAEATVGVTPQAPWSILEDGTRGHLIAAKASRRRRRLLQGGSDTALAIGDTWIQGPVRVSGAPGKQTFSRGCAAGIPDAIRVAHEQFAQAVISV